MSDAKEERTPLPPGWSKLAQRGLLNVVAAARLALLQVLAGFENGRVSEARLLAQNERLKERIAQLETELSIKDNRMGRLPVTKRPHYPPEERLRILLLRAATGWSLTQTAKRFLLSPQTIANWMKRLDDDGPDALVRTPEPVNRFPDFVREAVRQLAATSPQMGRQRIADTLARVGLDVAASSVRRITPEPPKPSHADPEDPIKPPSTHREAAQEDPRGIQANRPDHVWHCDLTVVPTAMGYWLPWFPLSVVLGWPFAWWVAGVVDQYSRAVIAVKAFGKQPDSAEVTAFLDAAIAKSGRAPEHLISDRGVQFQADYREWCDVHGMKPRWGAVGSHKSIAIIERFWRTLKDECCRRIVVPLGLVEMQSELDVYAAWYNEHRPHRALGGATPAERRAESVADVVRLEARARVPIRGDPELTKRASSLDLSVDGYEGRKHLPVVTLRAA